MLTTIRIRRGYLSVLFMASLVCFTTSAEAQRGLAILNIVEKEEAKAKEIRLNWISEERTRIRKELEDYKTELEDLRKIVPDPVKPRVLSRFVDETRRREKAAFNNWTENNDPRFNAAIMRGEGLNALLRILGPISHYRRLRASSQATSAELPSLKPGERIELDEVSHYRLVPATSAGSKVTVRLNQLPLDLQWPPVITQNWNSDAHGIQRLRDEFVRLIGAAGNQRGEFFNQAELLDKSLELLQAKVIQKRRSMPDDTKLTAQKRMQIHSDLQDALRYLETVRATAERFKNAPGDFKVHHFPGGSVEEFLDFCYTHGMIFQESRPADQEYYLKLHRRMQDYAHDIQFVEDWKSDLEQRINELDANDKKLVWSASGQ